MFAGKSNVYKLGMVVAPIAIIFFLIAGFILDLSIVTGFAPSLAAFAPVQRWSQVGGYLLGILGILIPIYVSLKDVNRPFAALALVLGSIGFFASSLISLIGFSLFVKLYGEGVVTVLRSLLATSLILFGAIATVGIPKLSKWFGVVSAVAALLIFIATPLGSAEAAPTLAFLGALGFNHGIIAVSVGAWGIELTRERFLLRERERIRK